jgi:hypothetical protein
MTVSSSFPRNSPEFSIGHTAPIEKEIRALSSALEAVKDEQEYIVTRERLHRDSGWLACVRVEN